ncbi:MULTISPECIES: protein phosphatase 2C domain-containing protein [unclassified Ruegeria]|uniref:PP2C family protein-serine/threonine phosphatase n=1 Tax=unclassified Ruegeria TaxID=2625375 RepID=UPI001ADA6B66|nr:MULTISPECIES: protein phosphatase 2C domain-containing protein [unclassified Ruegeria]MBO9412484.1 serine/threonine-protein phosphatase [Ruegeria sp. R8_1]MBO9416278.1 serine/threonine-protein phosphatase [Ruegeria sp. R8_2]
MLATPAYDIALILDQGRRESQEDAVAARMFDAAGAGYIVVADGMGGHAAGDVASELVITAWREALDAELEETVPSESALIDALPLAAMQANAAVAQHSEEQGEGFNMGSTMLGILLLEQRVFWISIGDSPLYLFRDGMLRQVNEDHSMAPIIDAQQAEGKLTREEALSHPDRNQLTSVIMGAAIPKVDCPEFPLELTTSDVLIAGSDGLQYLSNPEIEHILQTQSKALAQDIADALWRALRDKNDPDQDNASIAVLKLTRND